MIKLILFILTGLSFCESLVAKPKDAFEFYDKSLVKCEAGAKEIKNMPPVRNQGTLPICFAMSTATVVQYHYCAYNESACMNGVPKSRKDTVSPLAMLAWTRVNSMNALNDDFNHTNLQFYGDRGQAVDALLSAAKYMSFYPESCYPFDQLTESIGSKEGQFVNLIKRAESEYKKGTAQTESSYCEDCLKEMSSSLRDVGILKSANQLREIFDEARKEKLKFSEFLYGLILADCEDEIRFDRKYDPSFQTYPPGPVEYEPLMKTIKNVLNSNNPLTMDVICTEYKPNGACATQHSVVIAGYSKVCKTQAECNGKQERCDDYLKVHNSWGADWNVQGDGGWVKAKSLLSYAMNNKEKMKSMLAWYSPPKRSPKK